MSRKMAPNREILNRYHGNRRYFHTPTFLSRWKIQLSVIASILTLGWVAYGWVQPKENRELRYTHGEVAACHTLWNQQCQACHVDTSNASASLEMLTEIRDRWNTFRCESCHAGSPEAPKRYAPHHADKIAADHPENDCAYCHADHQGKDFSLVKLKNDRCTSCHANLASHVIAGQKISIVPKIDRLEAGSAASHPEIALHRPEAKPYARTVKFNHGLHMMPGIVASAEALNAKPEIGFKLSDIPSALQSPYRAFTTSEQQYIQLQCQSCHQTNSVGSASNSTEAYMLPVQYEQHCQACHSLDMPLGGTNSGIQLGNITAPHHIQPKPLKEWLRKEVLNSILTQDPKVREHVSTPDFFQRTDKPSTTVQQTKMDVWKWTDSVVDRAYQRFFSSPDPTKIEIAGNGCLKCHTVTEEQITKVTSPTVWYTQAKFTHKAHTAMDCASCHAGMTTLEANPNLAKPHLPDLANCQSCHSKQVWNGDPGQATVIPGLNSQCTDCHSYHQHTSLLPGPKQSLKEYLTGKRPTAAEGSAR